MLDIMRRGQRWLTAVFVVGIGLVFAVFIGSGQPLTPGQRDAVISAGEHSISRDEFFRMRTRQEQLYSDAFGDNFDARKLRDTIDATTARVLLERAVLAIEAERLGLTVAKEEVERGLLAEPAFRDETGAFDREGFEMWIDREFGSQRVFRTEQRRAELATKLIRVLSSQAEVSEGEARLAARLQLEQIKLAFPVLNPASAAADIERDEAAVATYAAEHPAEIQALYDERIDQYDVPEQARARHILVTVPATAAQEELDAKRAVIEEARSAIEQGEDFAVLAESLSQDPGSAANGGDLGWFRRGQMVGPFDLAAFSLPIGELSQPIQTDFGFHLIRVEERKDAEVRTVDDVRSDLAFELMTEEIGRSKAREIAERLSEGVRSGKSLETAAREAELTLERTNWIKRRPDGFVPGLGAAPELLAVAFSLAPGESSNRIFEVGDQLALVQVLEREEPDSEALAAEVESQREKMRQEKLETLVGSWVDQRRAELEASGELNIDLTLVN